MPPKTFVTLFSGGGGSDLGLIQAGYKPVLAVEYDPEIANVFCDNFGDKHMVCADVREFDYKPFAGIDLLAASPVCTRASVANANRGETELDTTCAEAVARAIYEMRPNHFLMENVRQYRSFAAYKIITDKLDALGYWWDANVVNCADYNVPQSRIRLVVRAAKDGYLPPLPSPTRRMGWYEAIEDLLPSCPQSKLADWQLKRLPADFMESFYVSGTEMRRVGEGFSHPSRHPAATVKASEYKGMPKAVLVPGIPTNFSHEALDFVGQERDAPVLTASQPRHPFRAILVEGDAAGGRMPTVLQEDSPAFTLTASGCGRRPSDVPAAVLAECRVVALTDRCLARFQSFPDSYRLPAKRSIAARVIGNAVPPELFRRIAGGFN